MSEERGEASLPPSGAATPKGKLESLTKEDLVKFVKRQTVLLQRLKAKNAELESHKQSDAGKDLAKQDAANQQDPAKDKKITELEKTVEELMQDKNEAMAAYNSIQMNQEANAEQMKTLETKCQTAEQENQSLTAECTQFEKRHKELQEQMDCMAMKDETLMSTLQCLHQEQETLSQNSKKLIAEKSELQIKLEDLEEESGSWKMERDSLQQELKASETDRDKLRQIVDNMEDKNDQRKEQVLLLQAEIGRLGAVEEEKQSLSIKLSEIEAAKQELEESISASDTTASETAERRKALEDQLEEVGRLSKSLAEDLEAKVKEAECQIEILSSDKSTMEALNSNLNAELSKLGQEKLDLEQVNNGLKSSIQDLENERVGLREKIEAHVKEEGILAAKVEHLEFLAHESQEVAESLNNSSAEAAGGDGLREQYETVMKELEESKAKLSDYEATLGQEFTVDVIQNLQQELADAKYKLLELEKAKSDDSASPDNSDDPVPGHNEDGDEGAAGDENDDNLVQQVYTQAIVKPIEVSTYVEEDTELLKKSIEDLTGEKEVLKQKVKQLEEICSQNGDPNQESAKYTEAIATLQARRQHLEEKVAMVEEKHETLTFELTEVQAERDSLKGEMEELQAQMVEWENLMSMLKEEKDHMAQELEDSVSRDGQMKKELEFLMSSLNEAITERDSLQDEVFKMVNHDDQVPDEMQEMKLMVEDIIKEKNRLHAELESVLTSKADHSIAMQGLKRELETLKAEKEEVEREKESMVVRMELAQHKEKSLEEEFEAESKKSAEIEAELKNVRAELEQVQSQQQGCEEAVSAAETQAKEAGDVAEERKAYAVELEEQVLQLSNSLSESKNRTEELQEQLEAATSSNVEAAAYCQQIQELQHQRDSLQKSLDEITGKHKALEQDFASKEEASLQLRATLEDLESLKEAALFQAKSAAEQVESEKMATQDELERVKEEMSAIQSLLESKDKEMEGLLLEKEGSVSKVEGLEATVAEMETKVLERERSCQGLQSQADSQQAALEANRLELNSLKERVSSLTEENASLMEACSTKTDSHSSLVEELHAKNLQVSKLTDDLAVATAEKEKEREKLSEVQLSLDMLAKEFQGKETELEEERGKLAHQATEQMQQARADVEKVRQSLVEVERNAETHAASVEELKVKLREAVSEKVSLTNELEVKLEEAGSEKELLKNELEEAKEELSVHKVRVEEASQKSVSDMKERLRGKEAETDSLAQRVSEFESCKAGFESSIKELAAFRDNLQLRSEELEMQCRVWEEKAAQAEGRVQGLEKNLADVEQSKAELLTQMELLTNEKSKLMEGGYARDSQMQELLRQVEELKKELSNVRQDRDSKAMVVREREAAIQELEVQLKSGAEERASLETQVAQAEQECAALKMELVAVSGSKKEEEAKQASGEGDALRKQLKDKEDMNAKLKQLIIKAKKELGDKSHKVESISQELSKAQKELDQERESQENMAQALKALQENYKQLQSSLDETEDNLEKECKVSKTACSDVEELISQLADLKGHQATGKEEHNQLAKVVDSLKADIKTKDSWVEEQRAKLKVAEAEMAAVRYQLEEVLKQKQTVEQSLSDAEAKHKSQESDHKASVAKLEGKLKELQEQFSSAQHTIKQTNMLDLEMADYERTIANLNTQVAEKEAKVKELQVEVDKQEETISLMQTQIDSAEDQRLHADDRGNKLKQLLVKAKKDLADAKKLETDQRAADAQMKGQLESACQQVEEYKILLSEKVADNQRLQDKIRSLGDSGDRTVRSLEQKVQALSDDLDMARNELKAVQAEYDSYKVRAHSVLRQQKSKTPSEFVGDKDKHERERFENAVQHLKVKLQETQDLLKASKTEAEQAQEEHDRLQERHTKMVTDMESRDASSRLRIAEVSKERSDQIMDLQDCILALEAKKRAQVTSLKEVIASLREEHTGALELLQRQLDASEMDNVRLQREIQQMQRHSTKVQEDSMSPHEFYPISSHPVEERQEGEGSELVEPEPAKMSLVPQQSSAVSFEQLLSTPIENVQGIGLKAVSPTPSIDEEAQKANLTTAHKRIEHLTQLLSESEEAVSRLTEQAKILKDEIRRLERNVEREKDLQNLEYLKNIFLQFVCPTVGEQRQQLVPVLTTMLKLSPEEKARVQSVTEGDEQPQQGAQGAGWGAYLHRWSGLT